jgi:hypothetical protein
MRLSGSLNEMVTCLENSAARRQLPAFFRGPASLAVFAQVHCALHAWQIDGAGELISKPIAFVSLCAAQENFVAARPAMQFPRENFALVFAG